MYTAEHLVLNIMMKNKKNTNGFNQTFSSLDISSGYLSFKPPDSLFPSL